MIRWCPFPWALGNGLFAVRHPFLLSPSIPHSRFNRTVNRLGFFPLIHARQPTPPTAAPRPRVHRLPAGLARG